MHLHRDLVERAIVSVLGRIARVEVREEGRREEETRVRGPRAVQRANRQLQQASLHQQSSSRQGRPRARTARGKAARRVCSTLESLERTLKHDSNRGG